MSTHEIRLTIEIADETAQAVLEAAMYGGSNYWADFADIVRDDNKELISMAVLPHDADDYHYVDLNGIRRGMIQASAADKGLNPGIRNDVRSLLFSGADSVDWDAETADVILQFSLFGELVYG